MSLLKVTEQESNHQHLEQKPIGEILYLINQEDGIVPLAVSKHWCQEPNEVVDCFILAQGQVED